MSSQPAGEWDEMTQQQQDEIKVMNRLVAACATIATMQCPAPRDYWAKLAPQPE